MFRSTCGRFKRFVDSPDKTSIFLSASRGRRPSGVAIKSPLSLSLSSSSLSFSSSSSSLSSPLSLSSSSSSLSLSLSSSLSFSPSLSSSLSPSLSSSSSFLRQNIPAKYSSCVRRSFCCSASSSCKSGLGDDRDDADDDQRGPKSQATIDEESLLAEYFRSYKEDVWTVENDDERDVRWMEMLGERGVEGVFDLDELLEVLHAETISDIVCIRVPDHMNYADYLVIGSGFSFRHTHSVMEYVKKLYKGKKAKKDPHMTIEGVEEDEEWLAADMGNIVLHLFLPEKRREYDIETLWTAGPEFDDLSISARSSKKQLEDLMCAAEEDEFDSWDLDDDDDVENSSSSSSSSSMKK